MSNQFRFGARAKFAVSLFIGLVSLWGVGEAQDCSGHFQIGGTRKIWVMRSGGVAAFAQMNIDVDGYSRAYNPANYGAGAAEHICNAGRVFLPDGSDYEGSESNSTCTGKFMADFTRIKNAGWQNSKIGAISWYGILGQGKATIHGVVVDGVVPVLQKDGSGFYVSPTSLSDTKVADVSDQSRYVNPLQVPFAVIPRLLFASGVSLGTFGVAINTKTNVSAPFVVADVGPRIGEGSVALARLLAGQPLTNTISRSNRYVGQVDSNDVLWVFFGGVPANYNHNNPTQSIDEGKLALQHWGGVLRLHACQAVVPRN